MPDQYQTNLLRERPDICAARHKGEEMSVAANPAESTKSERRGAILRLLRHGAFTCEEAEVHCAMSHQTCSARFSELKRDGLIKQVGKQKNRSGRYAKTYTVA